jgi:hypothetical protein
MVNYPKLPLGIPSRGVEKREFRAVLTHEAVMSVRYSHDRGRVLRYAVVLLVLEDGDWQPVRLYDQSHQDHNDMHRYSRAEGKRAPENFHPGTSGEAMRAAMDLIRDGYPRMIEAWRR